MEEFQKDPEMIGQKIDFTNAFNSVQRDVSLKECYQNFPQIYKWVHFCYSQHSFLFFGNYIIPSEAGVQQGDPLGPFLFCLVLQVLVNKVRDLVPNLSLNNWYMDDGSLFGKIEDVLKAWTIIRDEGPTLGLFVNLSKCELISSSGSDVCFNNFEPDIIRILNGDMTILGSAIGSKQHCVNWISQKLNKKMPLLINKLENLGHSHSSFLLLLYCASFCKMVWYIRTIASFLISEACEHFDTLVMRCFENLLGSGLSKQSYMQACLGTKNGGVGLRASKSHSTAAYISSFFKSKPLVETFLSKSIVNPHMDILRESFNSLVFSDDNLNSSSCPTSQKCLLNQIDTCSFKSLLEDVSVLDKARIVSCTMPHANAWVRALPSHRNKFSCLEWSICMKRWLGIPIFNQDHLCAACQNQIMDTFGHHACVCPVKGDRIKRHNNLRDILFEFCSAAAWGPVKEKLFLFPGSSERPADIFIPNYSGGKNLFLDVAITCPVQHKYVVEAAQTLGFSCNDYAHEVKTRNFEPRVLQEDALYLPAVFESFGGFSRDLPDFFSKKIEVLV